ncbi:MAG: glycine zipper domain-containing protein [Desulfobacterales bacterium]|jgi:hypothetical protein
MKTKSVIFIFFLIVCSVPALAAAQDFIIFPNQGQSQAQLDRDRGDCQNWARQQTGFDPLRTPTATAPPPATGAPQGGLLRGAARGATVGVVGGAIAGDAGRGAAIGAGTGALIGGMRRSDQLRQEQHSQDQWARQQGAQLSEDRNRFNRAFQACMQGKGYTVN